MSNEKEISVSMPLEGWKALESAADCGLTDIEGETHKLAWAALDRIAAALERLDNG
jgi:hypothetical protein